MSRTGDAMRVLLDSPTDSTDTKFYDLISFDPRGLGQSTPNVHCFADIDDFRIWSTIAIHSRTSPELTSSSASPIRKHNPRTLALSKRTCIFHASLEAVEYIRRYFHTGELPPEGTVCEPFSVPFGIMPNETVEGMPTEAMLEGAKIMAAPIVAQQRIAEGLGHAGLHLSRGLAP